jgi:hypothetical protein
LVIIDIVFGGGVIFFIDFVFLVLFIVAFLILKIFVGCGWTQGTHNNERDQKGKKKFSNNPEKIKE